MLQVASNIVESKWSELKPGDKITIETQGVVTEVHPLSLVLKLPIQGETNFIYRDIKLISKQRNWKIGQELTSPEEMDELPLKSVVISSFDVVYQKMKTDANIYWVGGQHGKYYGSQDFFYLTSSGRPVLNSSGRSVGKNPKLFMLPEKELG
jgi:signal peptidase I